jgi:serine/threonine-protein phosphatase CPPED1
MLWLLLVAAVYGEGTTSATAQPSPFTFVQMCDPQLGFGGYTNDVERFEEAVAQINDLHPDFVVICGDLVNGASAKSFGDFKRIKAGLTMPCYCAPGNHDVGNNPTLGLLRNYRESLGPDFFSVEHKGCLLVILNTQLWKAPIGDEEQKQDAWLEKTLAEAGNKKEPVFIVQHYPPFVKEPAEPEEYFNLPLAKRERLLGLFERSGVVAILAGHTHLTLQRDYHGIQLVMGETTSKNFDKKPFGFTLWHINDKRPYQHEFVPLKDQKPSELTSK